MIPGRTKQHRVIMACDLYYCSIVKGFPRVALAAKNVARQTKLLRTTQAVCKIQFTNQI